ncbi:hypothetical protein [Agromyces badenianii]|uniref:hypothetical protein n=1 Tax=Agromyces badenianii TaxID=2080742 RepID=UPI000D59E266|nr:hypothetical protein [Agromyces badenianii]PWC03645.1 hypothetical protein DCE94_11585 [Agromyces badenianii]
MDLDHARLTARRDELRRVVYGAPGGHESNAVAELADVERQLEQLEQLAQLRAMQESAAGSAEGDRAAEGGVDDGVVARTGLSRPRPGRPWFARPVVALLGAAVAVAVGGGLAVALDPWADAGEPPRGLEVFERADDDVDAAPRAFVAALGREAVATFRNIGRAVGHDVWVFRDGRDVCMIAQRRPWSSWGANCVSETKFMRSGISQFITYDEFSGQARPAGLDYSSAVELTWTNGSAEVEWSIVPASRAAVDGVWVWVPASADGGSVPMTYEEWSTVGPGAGPNGS